MEGNLSQRIKLKGILTPLSALNGTLSAGSTLNGSISITRGVSPDTYEGAYDIVPAEIDREFPTEGMLLTQNMIVRAIPSNYGRISWDGTKLTVY